mgnify:FL=1
MQIIDFEQKGNVVRFYLGYKNGEQYGDDWDDSPYEHNAGEVYEKYIKGKKDIAFPYDDLILQPCTGALSGNSYYSKDDMKERRVPCIIRVPAAIAKDHWEEDDFYFWIGADGIQKFYFGDEMEPDAEPVFDGNVSWPTIIDWKEAEHE